MLDINQIVDFEKQVLEETYFDKVTVSRNIEKEVNNITKMERMEILKDEPCALSRSAKISPNINNGANNIEGEYTLFLSKKIQKGDKLIITQEDGKIYNTIAGEPNFHYSHYEVPVLIKERA